MRRQSGILSTLMSPPLERFLDAQDAPHGGYADALAEIRGGRKRSHWIWYVFPQIAGLGRSSLAEAYAIGGRDEAVAYLREPTLRARLVEITQAVDDRLREGVPLVRLMGSDIDALKLVSSLTLFRAAAADDAEMASIADAVLDQAAAQGYPRCSFTLTALGRSR